MKCEYIVIGGGIVGLSTAYNLLKKVGGKVCVFEKRFLGSGCTTRNAGRFRVHFGHPVNLRFAIESAGYLKKISRELGYNTLLSPTGYLWLVYRERTYRMFREKNIVFQKHGVGLQEIPPELLYKKYPYLRQQPDLIAGFFSDKNGSFHPDVFTYALSSKIERLGGIVREWMEVKPYVKNESVYGVIADDGRIIEGSKVIVAAGAWSGPLLESIGIKIPLEPVRKEIGVSEPFAYTIEPFIIDEKHRMYFSQTLKGELIFSCKMSEEPVGIRPLVNTIIWLKCMSSAMRAVLKNAGAVRIMRTWSGYYNMTPDKSHVMGRCPEWPDGLYVITGFSGHGFMLGPYAGSILAKSILDEKVREDYIRTYSPCRFGRGELVEESFVVG